ncbi:MAG: hypothetical protein R3C58_10775 [Parvularculaceae bacterium]
MTGNMLLDSLISLGAIALMVGCAWVFFPAKPLPVSQALAAERLAFDEPDFRPVEWLLDRDGRAALARGENGDVALVSRLGIDLVTRRFRPGGVHAAAEEGALVIRPADPGSRKVRLASDNAADWARKLSPAHGM